MTLPNPAPTRLDILPRADGSAQHSQNGYTILGAINAPIEVQRRDELPCEAAIEVNVRPAVGIGGVRERQLESVIHATVRAIVLVQAYPRSLIQLTLQILSTPAESGSESGSGSGGQAGGGGGGAGTSSQSVSPLPLLPALLQTALLCLLSAAIPLSTTYTSVLVAVPRSRSRSRSSEQVVVVVDPSPTQSWDAESLHVLTFSARGELLVVESEGGGFEVAVWERVCAVAERVCCGRGVGEMDVEMMDVEGQGQGQGMGSGLEGALRDVVSGKGGREWRWRREVVV